jgi:triphosphatase
VIPVVVGSNPIGHPTTFPAPQKWRAPPLSPQSTPSSLCAAVQEAALAQIAANRDGVLRSRDPEYLHQLRVGMRRLRSALRAFKDLLPRKQARRLARRISRVMREIGAARDWDVFAEWLGNEQAPRDVVRAARRECARARAAARRSASRLSLHAISPRRSGEPMAQFAAAVLKKLQRKTLKQARRMDWDEAGDRHALRIRVKRLRYASEFFGRKDGGLERLQDVLGELNDVEVARRLLRGLRVTTPDLYRSLELRESRLLRALERMKTSSMGQVSGRRG